MSKSSPVQLSKQHAFVGLLAASVAWVLTSGCGSESPGTGTGPASSSTGGTQGAGALTGGTLTGGTLTGGTLTGGTLTGGTLTGGTLTGGTTDASTGAGGGTVTDGSTTGNTATTGVGGALGDDVPVYEQDDPNLVPSEGDFQRLEIPVALTNAMAIDIDKDENVYVLERAGGLKIWQPEEGTVLDAGTLPVFSGNEDGALSLSLDPNFSREHAEGSNHYVYIYYSSDEAEESKLSRFVIEGDALDLASESVMLTIPDEREVEWHVAGGMDFDSQGNLYLSTGDNTNPFESDGYSPHDEGGGRALFDAQRTAANSNDLRGKILRIKPTPDGGYEIPEGNLFSDGQGRPEVYTMGNRNPFRIAVDWANDWLYWGEVGPDADDGDEALGSRGPRGYDEFNQAKSAGNFGWPYCIGENVPYVHYGFGTVASRGTFNCDAPTNQSPNNTGMTDLPQAQPSWIAYSYGNAPYPALTNGTRARTGLMGDVYRWQPGGSINKLPRYYDGSKFLLEYSRGFLVEVRTDADGNVMSVENFLDGLVWSQPIHMRISQGGVMYVAQYGDDSTVYRINYLGDNNRPPQAVATSDVDSGPLPLTVQFSSESTSDFEDDPLTYAWDFNGDSVIDSVEANPSYTYQTAGSYEATLEVNDGNNNSHSTLSIVAGNTRPVVSITSPVNGGFVGEGESVDYTVSVTDAEDGTTDSGISCDDVTILPGLGHDLHVHDGAPTSGCTGSITTTTGLIPSENAWQVLKASYPDQSDPALQLTGSATIRLHFKRKQAEHFMFIGEASDEMETEETSDPEGGGLNLAYIDDGHYLCYNEMNFQNVTSINYRVASDGVGGRIEVRQGSPTGTQLGVASVEPTGGWQNWATISGSISDPGVTDKMCFVFLNNPGDELLFNLNWIEFAGQGVSQ